MLLKKHVETKTYAYDNRLKREEILLYLNQRPSSDGALGLEWLFTKNDQRLNLFMNLFNKHDLPIKETIKTSILPVNLGMENVSCYTIYGFKSPCFPFKMNYKNLIWDDISNSIKKSINNEDVFFQVIVQKKAGNRWRDELRQNYNDYISGIDTPTNNPLIRSLQLKILEFFVTKEEWLGENPEISETEDKLDQDGFDVFIRLFISGGDNKSRDKIMRKIMNAFSLMNYANHWTYRKIIKKQSFIESIQLRRIASNDNRNILCTYEVLPFFSKGEEKVALVKKENVIENTEDKRHDKNSLYGLLPSGDRKTRESDSNISEKLNHALKRIGVLGNREIAIHKIQHGATMQRIEFKLPEGLRISDLNSKVVKDLQTELALQNINIEQGKAAGSAALLIPQKERETVYLKECVENEDFNKFSKEKELPFIVGMDEVGELICECLTRIKHLLIVGTTGSGKSVFLNCLLLMLLTQKHPKEMQMILIDPKKVELSGYANYPHVLDVVTDMNKAQGYLSSIVEKMEERYELLSHNRCKNIQQYNKKNKDKLPYIIVVIEELADLILSNPKVEEYIIRIAQKARAAGIHLIIATQRPTKEVVTGLIKANIFSRVCFACDSGISYRVALDEKPLFDLLGRGDGVYRFEGIQGLHRFQSPIISVDEDEADEIVEKLSSYWDGNFKKESIEYKNVPTQEELEYEQLKHIIAETKETRLGQLQKMMKIRTSRVKNYMEQLVEEGWLNSPEFRQKGYELTLSDDELDKYLRQY